MAAKHTSGKDQFGIVFGALRTILEPYATSLNVVHDEPGHFYLDTFTLGPNKRPVMFAAVKINKNYVSYHLMPVYTGVTKMSPALKKRMQGKACFNFTDVDPGLMKELAAVTKRGHAAWKKLKRV